MREVIDQVVTDEADIVECKTYAQNRYAHMETVVSDEFGKARAIIDE